MAKKKRRTVRPRVRAGRVGEGLAADLAQIDVQREQVRRAIVADLKAQRKEIDRQLRAAGHRRGRRKARG